MMNLDWRNPDKYKPAKLPPWVEGEYNILLWNTEATFSWLLGIDLKRQEASYFC